MLPAVWEPRFFFSFLCPVPFTHQSRLRNPYIEQPRDRLVNRPIRSRSTSACSSAWGGSSDCPSESWPWRLTRTSEGQPPPRRWLLLRAGKTWRVFFFSAFIRECVPFRRGRARGWVIRAPCWLVLIGCLLRRTETPRVSYGGVVLVGMNLRHYSA